MSNSTSSSDSIIIFESDIRRQQAIILNQIQDLESVPLDESLLMLDTVEVCTNIETDILDCSDNEEFSEVQNKAIKLDISTVLLKRVCELHQHFSDGFYTKLANDYLKLEKLEKIKDNIQYHTSLEKKENKSFLSEAKKFVSNHFYDEQNTDDIEEAVVEDEIVLPIQDQQLPDEEQEVPRLHDRRYLENFYFEDRPELLPERAVDESAYELVHIPAQHVPQNVPAISAPQEEPSERQVDIQLDSSIQPRVEQIEENIAPRLSYPEVIRRMRVEQRDVRGPERRSDIPMPQEQHIAGEWDEDEVEQLRRYLQEEAMDIPSIRSWQDFGTEGVQDTTVAAPQESEVVTTVEIVAEARAKAVKEILTDLGSHSPSFENVDQPVQDRVQTSENIAETIVSQLVEGVEATEAIPAREEREEVQHEEALHQVVPLEVGEEEEIFEMLPVEEAQRPRRRRVRPVIDETTIIQDYAARAVSLNRRVSVQRIVVYEGPPSILQELGMEHLINNPGFGALPRRRIADPLLNLYKRHLATSEQGLQVMPREGVRSPTEQPTHSEQRSPNVLDRSRIRDGREGSQLPLRVTETLLERNNFRQVEAEPVRLIRLPEVERREVDLPRAEEVLQPEIPQEIERLPELDLQREVQPEMLQVSEAGIGQQQEAVQGEARIIESFDPAEALLRSQEHFRQLEVLQTPETFPQAMDIDLPRNVEQQVINAPEPRIYQPPEARINEPADTVQVTQRSPEQYGLRDIQQVPERLPEAIRIDLPREEPQILQILEPGIDQRGDIVQREARIVESVGETEILPRPAEHYDQPIMLEQLERLPEAMDIDLQRSADLQTLQAPDLGVDLFQKAVPIEAVVSEPVDGTARAEIVQKSPQRLEPIRIPPYQEIAALGNEPQRTPERARDVDLAQARRTPERDRILVSPEFRNLIGTPTARLLQLDQPQRVPDPQDLRSVSERSLRMRAGFLLQSMPIDQQDRTFWFTSTKRDPPEDIWKEYQYVKDRLEEMWNDKEEESVPKSVTVGEILDRAGNYNRQNALTLVRVLDKLSLQNYLILKVSDNDVIVNPFEVPYVSERQMQFVYNIGISESDSDNVELSSENLES